MSHPTLAHHNAVILKGRREGISIELDPYMPFPELMQHFHNRVVDAKQFFAGAKSNVVFKGRTLTDSEERALLDVIAAETTLDVPFVTQEGFRPVANPSFTTNIGNSSPSHLPHNVQITAYHQGGLRGGQSIRYSGSVVVNGDVNPGSEIIASGHIIVLGALKGMAHAGSTGDETCFVSALVFMPTQLRIANIITYIPNDKMNKRPASAYIQNGQVYIIPLVN